MRPPPAKPFALAFLACLGIFIAWGIAGSALEPQLADPAAQQRIGKIVLPVAFGLFLVMGFSGVPVMTHLFFKLFFKMQAALGQGDHPVIRAIREKQQTIAAVVVYTVWAIYGLGILIGAPFFIRDMVQ